MVNKDPLPRTNQDLVREFHRVFGHPIGDRPHLIEPSLFALRRGLIDEEYQEFVEAWAQDDLIGVADAIGDMLYVVYGLAIASGIDADMVVREIHRSNMTKLGVDGEPIVREDGKILKGPHYEPPNLREVLGLP